MENQEDKASLEGKGWDILAGGEEHASEAGGEDPFDKGEAASSAESPFAKQPASPSAGEPNPFDEPVGASLTAGGENPFDSDAAGEVLDSGHGTAEADSLPPDAYGDWGRGGERPEPVPTPGDMGEPEPRDLKPEDLGYQPGGASTPAATTTTPATEETPPRDLSPDDDVFAGVSEEAQPPDRLVPPTSEVAVGKALSDGVEVSGVTDRPLSETLEVGQPSRFATPPEPTIAAHFEVYDPFAPVGEPPFYGQPGDDLPLDAGLGPQLITPERVDELWDEINTVYEEVVSEVRGHFRSTETLLVDLKKAREYLLSGLENYDNAEVIVKRVKARLELEKKVRHWSRTIGSWIAIYLVAWLATIWLLTIVNAPVVTFLERFMPRDMALAYVPALWGALGGVLGGLWVLIEHTARKRDFDPIHTRWYVLNPFMGMGLGVVVYGLFQVGVVVGGAGTGQTTPQVAEFTESTPWLLYAICLVVGFQQNVVWDLLDRVLNLIRPQADGDDEGLEQGPDFLAES